MQEFIVTVRDESKSKPIIELLKSLDYLEVKEQAQKVQNKKAAKKQSPDLRNLIGIWKGRKISAKELRERAWGRTK